jgi:uncharacterized protein (TIGR03437 family)
MYHPPPLWLSEQEIMVHLMGRILVFSLLSAAAFAQTTRPPGEGPNHERRRIDWFLQQRATPQGVIPADLRMRAWREMETGRTAPSIRRPGTLSAAGSPWTNIGPFSMTTPYWLSPISGRINAIVSDPRNPKILFIGASEGGIWKSTDGGVNFTPLTDSQPSLAIGALAIDPSNPDTIYAGTGGETYGAGFLKSSDAGATWKNYPGPFVGPYGSDNYFGGGARILAVAVSPTDSNLVLAALWRWPMTQAGIFRSTDAGVTWNQVLAGPGKDVQFLPGSSTRVFATMASYYTSSAAGLYQSTDAGQTWAPVTGSGATPLPAGNNVSEFRLATSASPPYTIYVSVELNNTTPTRIYRSTDTGASWSLVSTAPNACCTTLIVDPVDANLVIGGAIGGNPLTDVYRSTDAGVTWTDISGVAQGYDHAVHADARGLYFAPDGSAFYVGCDAGIFKTGDPHISVPVWTPLNGSLTITEFYPSFGLHPTDPTIMVGGTQDNGTINLGSSKAWAQSTCGDAGWSAIDPSDPSVMYTTCQNVDIFKSTAAGAFGSWNRAESGIPTSERSSFIPPLVLDASRPQTLYFGTYRVYQTTNGASSWTAISPDLTAGGTVSTIAIAPSDSNTVYAGTTDSHISVTTNAVTGTPTWTRRDKAPLPTRFITQIAVDPTNSLAVYVTYSGFSGFNDQVGHVFRSLDGGVTWKDISGNLPNIPVNDIVIDPDIAGTLYVGTDLGVFASFDSGATWSVFGTTLPRVIVNALKLHRPTRTLRAATYGRGIWDLAVPVPSGPPPVISQVQNASGEAATISQNTWIEIKGTNLSQTTRGWTGADFINGQMPLQLDGVSATVDGQPAFVSYVSPTQVNVLTPLDAFTGQAAVQVMAQGGASAAVNVTMLPYSLGFFAFNSDKYAAAQHLDYSLMGPANLIPGSTTPAKPNETIILYGNGFGQVIPAIVNGAAAQSGTLPLPWPVVTIGGLQATVKFAGAVSAGLYQFNVVVPDNAPDGDNVLSATYKGATTHPGVFITVQH